MKSEVIGARPSNFKWATCHHTTVLVGHYLHASSDLFFTICNLLLGEGPVSQSSMVKRLLGSSLSSALLPMQEELIDESSLVTPR